MGICHYKPYLNNSGLPFWHRLKYFTMFQQPRPTRWLYLKGTREEEKKQYIENPNVITFIMTKITFTSPGTKPNRMRVERRWINEWWGESPLPYGVTSPCVGWRPVFQYWSAINAATCSSNKVSIGNWSSLSSPSSLCLRLERNPIDWIDGGFTSSG